MPVLTDNDDLLRLVKLASSGDNEALSLLVSKMIPDVRREASKFPELSASIPTIFFRRV